MSAAIELKHGFLGQESIEGVELVGQDVDLSPKNEFLVAKRQLNLIRVLKVEFAELDHRSLLI